MMPGATSKQLYPREARRASLLPFWGERSSEVQGGLGRWLLILVPPGHWWSSAALGMHAGHGMGPQVGTPGVICKSVL